jgi:[ribulose-bisphosphate carboxylase]/[fructose-bisphosphate aldolase]-lysine N-methyltransferase
VAGFLPFAHRQTSLERRWMQLSSGSSSEIAAAAAHALDSVSVILDQSLKPCRDEIAKTCKVKVAPVATNRLGLVATESIKAGEVALAMPYDDRYILTARLAANTVFKDSLPESYNSWTGEAGLIALLVLNEVARAADCGGIQTPQRPAPLQAFMAAWVSALPSLKEMEHHPLFWSAEDQEALQSSSTNKIYRRLDDLEEDATWLSENVFDKDRSKFPEVVSLNGANIPCFNLEGFKWAISTVQSRAFFLDGSLRLIPIMDMCNHSDDGVEIRDGFTGNFRTTQCAQLVASVACAPGDEVLCSYGPKSAADYLLEHGFCPEKCWNTAVSELTFEIDPADRFRDDKLDILEFETDDQAPMDPVQSFDVVSAPGRDGEPDDAMIQFLRLCKLGGTDAFLLESIFRKDAWGFMELPVSEGNELLVVTAISEACQQVLDEFSECRQGGPPVCTRLRESETRALSRTMEFLQREKEALDLKEYYQERRLKELGLNSEWSPEDDIGEDLSFGRTRAPGGADYDW